MNARTIGIGLVAALLVATVTLVALTSGSPRESGADPRSEAAEQAQRDTTGAPLVPAQLPGSGASRTAAEATPDREVAERAWAARAAKAERRRSTSLVELTPQGARGVLYDVRGEPAVEHQVRLVPMRPGEPRALDITARIDEQRRGPERTTDGQGAFEFPHHYRGLHQLWAFRRGGPAWPGPLVDLVPGEHTAEVEFHMLGQWPGHGTWIVVSAGDGEPVPGAAIQLEFVERRERNQRASVESDAEGTFFWAGFEGEWLDTVHVEARDLAWMPWESGPLAPGLTRLDVLLQERPLFVLTVLDEDGNPVLAADRITLGSLRSAERKSLFRPRSEDGRWEFALPSRPCSVSVAKEGYDFWEQSFEDPAVLLRGLEVVLQRAPRVRVRVTHRGAPASQVPVSLLMQSTRHVPKALGEFASDADQFRWKAQAFTTTDPSGAAELPLVVGVDYRAGAWDSERGVALSAPFVGTAGGRDVELQLEPRTRIEGRFEAPPGVALEDVRLQLLEWRSGPTPLVLGRGGGFEIAGVLPGAVRFQASWPVGDGLETTSTLGPYSVPDTASHQLLVRAKDGLRNLRVKLPALGTKARGELMVAFEDLELAVSASYVRERFRNTEAAVHVPRPGTYRVTVTSRAKRGPELVLSGSVRVGEESETLWEPPLVLGRLLALVPEESPKSKGPRNELRYIANLDDGTLVVARLRTRRQRVKGGPSRYGIDAELPVGQNGRLVFEDGVVLPVSLREGATVELELPTE